MTFLLWLYQFIGAVFLGVMINTVHVESGGKAKPIEWLMILWVAIVWPYWLYLIYRQGVKS